MMSLKRKNDEEHAPRALKTRSDPGFTTCTDVDELIPKKLISANMLYDETNVFLITRLRYDAGFLYLFLTGPNDVQFYFRTPCTIYSYKRCFHIRTPCFNKCSPFKSMVVTGFKPRECHRINVYKVDRSRCAPDEPFLLDEFCTDENRVQMQVGLYEGDYVRFENGIRVNEHGCAVGPLSCIQKIPIEKVKEPVNPIVGCYDLETYTNLNSFSNPKVDPVITISYVLKTQFDVKRYCLINTNGMNFTLDDEADEDITDGDVVVIPFHDERDMIVAFFKLLCGTNPDDILDYNGDKFDLPYLLERADQLNIDKKFIRRYDLTPTNMNTISVNTKFGYSFHNYFMKYFNHVDVYQFVKNSIDAGKIENMKLNTVANYYLKVGKVELSVREMMSLYNSKRFANIVRYNVRDSVLPIEMYFKCKMANKMYADSSLLYLSRDDSNLTIWRKINLALFNRAMINKTESGSPDEYFFNKFDLNKIMHKKKIGDECDDDNEEGHFVDYTNLDRTRVPTHLIPTDATPLCDLKTRMKYTGGKVISPRPGYYKLTFTLDFSQLYTSIMIHHTTCLSNLFYGSDNKLYLQRDENAITTKFLKEMAGKRAAYKTEMKKFSKDSFEYHMYDSWQNAAKLVCNSQYGWFGLCCKALANFITAQGRIKLTEAEGIIRGFSENDAIKKKWNLTRLGLDVVYGDTDSNFVNIDILPDELERIGGYQGLRRLILEDIVGPLNDTWGGAFKMELENIMRCMLIKGKKAYMCLKEDGTLYKRGFNVKKDSPLFLRQAFDAVIMGLLTDHSLDCVLSNLVETLKKKRDEFCVANCEEYSFSQTLNETKNGGNGDAVTIAYLLYMQLRNDANTKYVPSSGDRIPYLLIDKYNKKDTVRDRVKPTQLFNADDRMNWSKHLGIVCTFLNDVMSMVGNDTLFVHAFELICRYFQKDQCFGVIHPYLKPMTNSRLKDVICKEINVKKKKQLSDGEFSNKINNKEYKFIHTHEFTMTKRAPSYEIDVGFGDACPTCNGQGVSAVERTPSLVLREPPKKRNQKNK